jgi:predicted MPP superfamily phosphohydrolase
MKKINRRNFLKLCARAGGLGLIASYPVFIERYIVQTNIYRIPVPNLPPAFSGFRIVHLTDLHYGLLVQQHFIHNIISEANRIKRDITVCTGDYVHAKKTTEEIDTVWPLMAKLNAPSGVFSVLGNHDHWADTQRSQYWLTKTGQDLRHKLIPIEKHGSRLWLAGAGDLWEDHTELDGLLSGIPESDCRIVLAHNPDTADTNFSSRIDLMISGHTHGGQVNIPLLGTPVLPVKNKNYSSGLKCSPRGMGLFISRGIGWAIYPVRFNCFPEIAVLELVPADSQTQQSQNRTLKS